MPLGAAAERCCSALWPPLAVQVLIWAASLQLVASLEGAEVWLLPFRHTAHSKRRNVLSQPSAASFRFPVADVRDWVAAMVRNGSWDKHNPGVPPPAPPPPPGAPATEDTQAAQALRSLSASRCTSGGGDETLSAAQPTTSTGRQPRAESARQLQRAGSELKRKGALDIMVQAADL